MLLPGGHLGAEDLSYSCSSEKNESQLVDF